MMAEPARGRQATPRARVLRWPDMSAPSTSCPRRTSSTRRRRAVDLTALVIAAAATPAVVRWLGPDDPASAIAVTPTAVAADPLVGLWSAHDDGGAGTPVAFYYFHGDGHGLYRYGRVGLTNTNSFDYTVEGDHLALHFRKTGARHRVRFAIEHDGGAAVLVLVDDPKGAGTVRYRQRRNDPVEHDAAGAGRVDGRLWLDRVPYATGGYGFSLYQLRAGGIDGRGTGWFHRGDFDDWTTEALGYRIVGDRLELEFASGDRHATTFVRVAGEPASLTLHEDPRDFWHAHRYVDAGPSFGQAGAAALGPLGPAAIAP
jgi:hypothetical protein